MGETEGKIVVNIPFLFWDVIGRVFPGGFLILGAAISWSHFLPTYCFGNPSQLLTVTHISPALATLVVGVITLAFGITASFLGFILGALSNQVIEKWIWKSCSPLTTIGLANSLGINGIDELKARFRAQFGSDLKEESLNESSFLCAYFGWRVNPTLGAMQGRWDADLLASQSFVLVTAMLLSMVALEWIIVGYDLFILLWTLLLIVIGIGSCLNFNYHRKKRVYGRFALFLALTNNEHRKGADSGLPTDNSII